MLIDREQLLTPLAGQLFNATDGNAEYGSAAYDLKSDGYNPAIGEPIEAYFMLVGSDVNNLTSYDIAIVADDDGAGTNEVSLVTKNVLLASLTEASGVQHIGSLSRGALGAAGQYLTAKVTTHGSTPTTGLMRIWLAKGTDVAPNNPALKL